MGRVMVVVVGAVVAALAAALVSVRAQEDPISLAYTYVEFASAAFCDEPEVLAWQCPSGSCRLQRTADTNATAFITTARTGVNSYVAYNDRLKVIVAAFRGTDNTRNLLVDLRIRTVPYAGAPADALVHTGFYNAWVDVSEDIVAEVTRLQAQFPSYSVACVGHSLGGALALHCSADLRQRGFNVTAYTYGQPRVGNAAFSDWYTSVEPKSLRITAFGDIFTQLPPQALDYRYQVTEVFYNNQTDAIRVCSATDAEDPTCSNSVPVALLNGEAHVYYLGVVFGECYLQ